MSSSRWLRLSVWATALSGCGGSFMEPDQGSNLDEVFILDPPNALAVGEDHRLEARGVRRECDIDFCRDDVVGATVTWSSSDPAVLEVLPSGVLRARKVGTATITARHDNLSGTARIRVGAARIPLSVGMGGTCGLAVEGKLYCWGFLGRQGVGGDGWGRLEPIPLSAPSLSSISSSGAAGCGVALDETVYCWSTTSLPTALSGPRLSHVSVGPPSDFTASRHACGLDAAGEAWCWGTSVIPEMQATKVPGDLAFASISAGGGHDCAVTPDKQVYCWGRNEWGQLGRDTNGESRAEPQPVEGLPAVTKVIAGESHTCALGEDRRAWCWGHNNLGYLGRGIGWDSDPHPVPLAVPNAPELVSLDGTRMICGLTPTGEAFCWGDVWSDRGVVPAARWGGLGVGVVVSVFTGGWFGSSTFLDSLACGETTTGVIYCWGRDLKPERLRGPIT